MGASELFELARPLGDLTHQGYERPLLDLIRALAKFDSGQKAGCWGRVAVWATWKHSAVDRNTLQATGRKGTFRD